MIDFIFEMQSIFLFIESFMTLSMVYKESLYKPKDFSKERRPFASLNLEIKPKSQTPFSSSLHTQNSPRTLKSQVLFLIFVFTTHRTNKRTGSLFLFGLKHSKPTEEKEITIIQTHSHHKRWNTLWGAYQYSTAIQHHLFLFLLFSFFFCFFFIIYFHLFYFIFIIHTNFFIFFVFWWRGWPKTFKPRIIPRNHGSNSMID